MNKIFSKPILCANSDDFSYYIDDIDFNIEIIENKINVDTISFKIQHNMTSKIMFDLLINEKVSLFCKIKTAIKSQFFKVDFLNEINVIEFERKYCQRNEKIEVTYYIVAETKVILKNNEEFKSDLIDDELEFEFDKGELMGLSNTIVQHYSLQGTPFINLRLAEEQENNGLLFSVGDNVINIKIGSSFNEAYSKLKTKNECKYILNSFLAFNSILYAILSIVNDEVNDYKNKEWFKCLDMCFIDEKYECLNDFIENMRENMDINEIYRICQCIIGNSLEKNIVLTRRLI